MQVGEPAVALAIGFAPTTPSPAETPMMSTPVEIAAHILRRRFSHGDEGAGKLGDGAGMPVAQRRPALAERHKTRSRPVPQPLIGLSIALMNTRTRAATPPDEAKRSARRRRCSTTATAGEVRASPASTPVSHSTRTRRSPTSSQPLKLGATAPRLCASACNHRELSRISVTGTAWSAQDARESPARQRTKPARMARLLPAQEVSFRA